MRYKDFSKIVCEESCSVVYNDMIIFKGKIYWYLVGNFNLSGIMTVHRLNNKKFIAFYLQNNK